MYGKRFLVLIAAAVTVAAGLSLAQNATALADPAGRFIHWRVVRLSRHLDLTDAQQQQLQATLQAEVPRLRPLMQQLAEQKKQMLAATAAGQFDQARVSAIANQQAQTMAALIVARQEIASKVYTLLTPEQRIRFDQMRQQRLERMQRRLAGTGAAPN